MTKQPVDSSNIPWQRLHSRMVWVDFVQTLLSLTPLAIAVFVFGVEFGDNGLWTVIAIAVFGTLGAASDAVRWVFTRYRITDKYVEGRTGVFVRSYRSVRRDRIRSVDIEATLRHRLSGLRVVNIGAGQQAAAGESAFEIDAVLKQDAETLRHILLRHEQTKATDHGDTSAAAGKLADEHVFAKFQPWLVVFNVFNIWAYVMALGLLWGGYYLLNTFGLDVEEFVMGSFDWGALGWVWGIVAGVLIVGVVGVIGMAVNYFTEYWNFELARVPGEKGTLLRTRKGLFTTKEINRSDNRLRGIDISEPLFWRWMGAADTTVVTTGLDMSAMSQPAAILPRGPVAVARLVAARVLAVKKSPFEAPLQTHSCAALRRRLWWATGLAALVVAVLGWLAITEVVSVSTIWAGVAFWPVALGAAVIAYRSLGHAIVGKYAVMRSGLFYRSTTALQRTAVNTVAIRESLLQRRLGLKTVSTMTSAGYGVYEAPDLDTSEALKFAAQAAPGLLEPFLVRDDEA